MPIDVRAWEALAGVCILLCIFIASNSSWFMRVCLGYFLLHACITAFYPNLETGDLKPWIIVQVQKNAALILAQMLLLLTLKLKWYLYGLTLLINISALDMICIMFTGWSFLFTWPTFAMGIYACVMPVVVVRLLERGTIQSAIFVGLFVLTVLIRDSGATAALCIGVGVVALAVASRQWLMAVGFALAGVGFWHFFPQNPWDRLGIWDVSMTWWENHASPWVGVGTGAHEYVGLFLPLPNGKTFYLMHNDYLTVLFNQGSIGLGILLAIIGVTLHRSFRNPGIFATLCAFCACSLVYFPMHYFASQFMILSVATAAWGEKR